jgi:hypothetical protein
MSCAAVSSGTQPRIPRLPAPTPPRQRQPGSKRATPFASKHSMSDEIESHTKRLEAIRCTHVRLVDQIRQSQEMIEHSQVLLKRIDEMGQRPGSKP